jgi:hypothetical protein
MAILSKRDGYACEFSVNGTSTSLARYPAPAIFHPMIAGRKQIATRVKPAIAAFLGSRPSSVQSGLLRLLAQGQYLVSSTVNGNRILDSC